MVVSVKKVLHGILQEHLRGNFTLKELGEGHTWQAMQRGRLWHASIPKGGGQFLEFEIGPRRCCVNFAVVVALRPSKLSPLGCYVRKTLFPCLAGRVSKWVLEGNHQHSAPPLHPSRVMKATFRLAVTLPKRTTGPENANGESFKIWVPSSTGFNFMAFYFFAVVLFDPTLPAPDSGNKGLELVQIRSPPPFSRRCFCPKNGCFFSKYSALHSSGGRHGRVVNAVVGGGKPFFQKFISSNIRK